MNSKIETKNCVLTNMTPTCIDTSIRLFCLFVLALTIVHVFVLHKSFVICHLSEKHIPVDTSL